MALTTPEHAEASAVSPSRGNRPTGQHGGTMNQRHPRHRALVAIALFGLALGASTHPAPSAPTDTAKASADAAELAKIQAERAEQDKNLANFEDLDFNVYNDQKR